MMLVFRKVKGKKESGNKLLNIYRVKGKSSKNEVKVYFYTVK